MEKIRNGNFAVALVLSVATVVGVAALLVSFVSEGVRRQERSARLERHRTALQIARAGAEEIEREGLDEIVDGMSMRYDFPGTDRALAYRFDRRGNGIAVRCTGIVGPVSRTVHLFIPDRPAPAPFDGRAAFALR